MPANLLWKELWSDDVPGVCQFPIRRRAAFSPLMIHAAAPDSSLNDPSLTA